MLLARRFGRTFGAGWDRCEAGMQLTMRRGDGRVLQDPLDGLCFLYNLDGRSVFLLQHPLLNLYGCGQVGGRVEVCPDDGML